MSTITPQQAAQRLLELRQVSSSFEHFVRALYPHFDLADFQLELIRALDALENGTLGAHRLMINMPPRHGKLISDDTPIYTPDGWRWHGDLKPGDYVYGPDAEPTQVVAVSEPGLADLEVRFANEARIRCHARHEWVIMNRNTRRWLLVETSWLKRHRLMTTKGPGKDRPLYAVHKPMMPPGYFEPARGGIPGRRIGIREVVTCPPTRGQCIQVDREDGLYVVGDPLVTTHNSFLASQLFPVYYLARNPERFILATSYNQDLAKTFGRLARETAYEPTVQQAFPEFRVDTASRAVDDWRTTEGGHYFATGIGGSTTGRAANLLITDDPVKAREEADSVATRNRTWSYYVSALTTRKQPETDGTPAKELLISTRWHPDDLAGRIQKTEEWANGEWKHISLPAIREVDTATERAYCNLPPDDPRYVPPEEWKELPQSKRYFVEPRRVALWPERFPIGELEKRERLDPREFAALYQQSPYIRGGNVLKDTWWQYYTSPPDCPTIIIAADTAFSEKTNADPTVMLVMGMSPSGDIYLLSRYRERVDFPDLKRAAIALNARWRGFGLRGMYVEDRASGQSLVQELRSESGISVIPVRVTKDKVTRIQTVAPLIEGGRVFLPEQADWVDEFLEETQAFPNGTHDDQVDALSIGLDVLSRMGGGVSQALTQPLELSDSLTRQLDRMDTPHALRGDLESTFGPGRASSTQPSDYRPKPLGEL